MHNQIQPKSELEEWHSVDDPWKYESTPDDKKRKNLLLSEIPQGHYKNTLDIGCGQGFITKDLPGDSIIGIDISHEAINKAKKYESSKLKFKQADIFEVCEALDNQQFDLIIITGVLYPQYIGNSNRLINHLIDKILSKKGILVSVHIDEWYNNRFPYLLLSDLAYSYRNYYHRLEVYVK